MIEAVGSITAPQAKPDDYAVAESDQVIRENEKIVEERPVEEPGNRSESEGASENNDAEKFLLKDNKMVFEKYNGSGEVILQIPPVHKDAV